MIRAAIRPTPHPVRGSQGVGGTPCLVAVLTVPYTACPRLHCDRGITGKPYRTAQAPARTRRRNRT